MSRTKIDKENNIVIKDFKLSSRRFKKWRFLKEKSLYERLEKDIPKLLDVENMKLKIEYIDGNRPEEKECYKAVEKLVDFQLSGVEPETNFILSLIDSPMFKTILFSFLIIPDIGIKYFFKLMKEIINYMIKGAIDEKILIHNDFHRSNIIKDNSNYYFLDLESATKVKYIIFTDINKYTFISKNMNYEEDILNYYLEILEKKSEKIYNQIDIELEKKIAEIFRSVKRIRSNSKNKDKYLIYLKEILD